MERSSAAASCSSVLNPVKEAATDEWLSAVEYGIALLALE